MATGVLPTSTKGRDNVEKHPIILTSHNPLFVDRQDISSNIIVTAKKAVPAKNINEIRQILGVRASDNLRNAELVLVVEGDDDRVALSALISSASDKLRDSLKHGKLAIDSLLGASNLSYKLSQLRDILCDTHSFLDCDKSGIAAGKKAEEDGLLIPAGLTYSTCVGMKEAEIEDMYDSAIYKDMLSNRYGITLHNPKFKNAKKKWSDRLRDAFNVQGKHWDESIEKKLKAEIADIIATNPDNALNQHKRSAFRMPHQALESKI